MYIEAFDHLICPILFWNKQDTMEWSVTGPSGYFIIVFMKGILQPGLMCMLLSLTLLEDFLEIPVDLQIS